MLEKEPISKLCDEVGLQPTVFYRWQKEFFENGAAAFEQKRPTNHSADQERIAYLQKKIPPRQFPKVDLRNVVAFSQLSERAAFEPLALPPDVARRGSSSGIGIPNAR